LLSFQYHMILGVQHIFGQIFSYLKVRISSYERLRILTPLPSTKTNFHKGWDSTVGITTVYGLDGRGTRV
jgi:hypothetical protein